MSFNGKNPQGQSIKLSGNTNDKWNHPCVSIMYTLGYAEGCTCLMTKSCAAELQQIILILKYNKGDDKKSLGEVCTYLSTKNKLAWKSL